jgi:glycosyltransferase involved in cell wall biosynthesis
MYFFSIIIPTYNSEATIQAALTSVKIQQFSNFEVLVIDGKSSDKTVELSNQFRLEGLNLTCISEPDNGIYDAMNKGIAAAKGEYLYFLGSDDTLFNEQVLHQVADSINLQPADLIYGNVLMSTSGQRYDGAFTYEKLLTKNISHQAIFYKRTIFQQLGGYNLKYKLHADWDFNLTCFKNETVQKAYIELIVAHFTEGSTSSKPDKTFIQAALLPAILQYQNSHQEFLRSIKNFDFLWRQIRNAQINSSASITGFNPRQASYILHMIRFQSMVSNKSLQYGVVSKALMTSCFLYCILKKAI